MSPATRERATLYGYVRPVPGASERLDAAVQRTAVLACARGERLGTPEVFEEGAPEGRAAFAQIASLVAGGDADGRGLVVVAATLAVLGDTAVERARRALLLESAGARLVFANGETAEVALRRDWEERPQTERRRDRAREAMRSRALRGLVLGRPPYGYTSEERVLTPHPRESRVVQRMFKEYLEDGQGLRGIASALNRDGIKTRLGRTWSPGAVRTVLRNPTYTGLYRRLGVAVPSAHPALVDRSSFQAVQRRLDAKRTARLKQERHEYLLAGLLRCGRCGSPMIGERRAVEGGVAVSYRCEAALQQGRCRARGQREEVLERAIRDALAVGTYPVAARPPRTPEVDTKRQRLERRLTESIERWIAGEWRYVELLRRVASTAAALQAAEQPPEPSPGAEEARRLLVEAWNALDFAERRALLQAAIAEAVVTGADVRITRRR